MSYFQDHKNCKIVNVPKGLVEIPVSVFEVLVRQRINGEVVSTKTAFKKFDIDSDIKFIFDCLSEAKETKMKYLVLFMHDYSDLNKLEIFLRETVNDEKIIYITAKEYLELRGLI